MGSSFSNTFNTNKEANILLLGLQNAGKTTILYKLNFGKIIPILPHIGFNVENIKYKGFNICCFDHEGGDRIRELWKPYYQYSQGIIFVVDSADVARIMEAKSELLKLLKIDELHDSVLLIFANKQDFPNAMLPNEIARVFQLDEIKDRPWKIQGMSAQTGDGIYEGLDWLDEQIMKMN